MQRRRFISLLTAALMAAGPVSGQSLRESVIAQLAGQGFARITVSRTLLGRMRFVAENELYRREIVINPSTGEVLRDYLVEAATGRPPAGITIPNLPETETEEEDDGDDGDDDRDSDDGDDDDDGDDGEGGDDGDDGESGDDGEGEDD